MDHVSGLQEFDALSNIEINDFRFKMRKMGEEIVVNKSKQTWLQRLLYYFPPRISTVTLNFSDSSMQLYQNGHIVLMSRLEDSEVSVNFIGRDRF